MRTHDEAGSACAPVIFDTATGITDEALTNVARSIHYDLTEEEKEHFHMACCLSRRTNEINKTMRKFMQQLHNAGVN